MMNVMQGEFGTTPDSYWALLASFDRECTAKGKQHCNIADYKSHFFDWTRRHVEINGKDGNKNKGKGYGNDRQSGMDGGKGRPYENRRDEEIKSNVNNMLAKYGLTTDDIGF